MPKGKRLSKGKQLPERPLGQEAIRQIGVSSATYFKWRTKYGAMNKDEARRLKDLEKENTELKKLVANLSLDNAIGHASGQRPQQHL